MSNSINTSIFNDADIDVNPLLEFESKAYTDNDKSLSKFFDKVFEILEDCQTALEDKQEQIDKLEQEKEKYSDLLDDLVTILDTGVVAELEFMRDSALEKTSISRNAILQYHEFLTDDDSELVAMDRNLYEIVRQFRGF